MIEFYNSLLDDLLQYIFILSCSLLMYKLLFKKYVFSFFDPLFLSLVFSSFATSVVIFLYFQDLIDDYFFGNFILTQLSFVVGFYFFKPISKADSLKSHFKKIKNDYSTFEFLYYASVLLFVFSNLMTYYLLGIPILNEYGRLTTYSDSGGLGVLSRIISVTRPIILIYILDCYIKTSLGMGNKLIFLFLLLTSILSGSKSALLEVVFVSILTQFFFWKNNTDFTNLNRIRNQFFFFAFAGAILIISLGQNTAKSLIDLLLLFINRFINSGDIFMYAYTSDVLVNIPNTSGLLAVFSDVLGFTRIIPYSKLPDALGLQIWQNYHENFNYQMGPNPRHNVFGLHYFGFYGAIFYSFIIGILSSFFRNKLYNILPKGLIPCVFYVLCYPLVDLRVDSTLAVSSITNILFIFCPLLFISYVLSYSFTKPMLNLNVNTFK